MTKRIEQLAIIVLILWVVSLIPNPLMTIVAARMYGHAEYMQFQFMQSALAAGQILLAGAVHIGVGIWLFLEARRGEKAKWVWLLFGVVFGLVAVVLFILLQIREELATRKEK